MGLISGLRLGRGAIPALGGVSREIARTIAPDLARGLAEAVNRLPVPDAGALPPARPGSGYDRLIDAINRLPRPLMAFGSQALVLYALVDPSGFAARMAGLDAMPEALWWLLGAVITAYFGARESHHLRNRSTPAVVPVGAPLMPNPSDELSEAANPALDDWRGNG
ncbi:MAG: 3TM-type holin [Pseudotabrizicola sp.]|uniref:3TM-type holin n=1 Tax=Pseudotabrizicola sp. TaxID=2939647 RepID=UPI00272379E7|nr:3TM-type holin [Pseudotabrizicola sp.]MDO8883542.1 3TM-type holin [Pseudotabrizicola sp.]MDP2083184.1 3TM-type holin [Pseudotabrizicola sp.]MDZ7572601.1 3TM-type holin [Pseudotabrizicola sp.]